MKRAVLAGAASLLIALTAALTAEPAHATPPTATITHVEQVAGGVRVLVSVPEGQELDLARARTTIGGVTVPTTARPADSGDQIRRTDILAIDVSRSMAGAKLSAAVTAARAFLATAPSDVYIGVVAIGDTASTLVAPTRDRGAAAEAISGLTLAGHDGTALYDGVDQALAASGTAHDGQRSVLLLSDGADAGSSATLANVTAAVRHDGVLLDAVAVDASEDTPHALAALHSLARAGKGQVYTDDAAQLRQTFADEAAALARQVVLTATVPSSVTATEGTVRVTLPTRNGVALSASVYDDDLQPVAAAIANQVPTQVPEAGLAVPRAAMFAGLGATGLGLLVMLLALMPRRRGDLGVAERITAYTAATHRMTRRTEKDTRKTEKEDSLATAKGAAASLLHRNAGLETRIAARLEGAGSDLKPPEWLLVHAGIVVLLGLVGLVLGHGSALLGILFVAAGAVGPWLYLSMRKNRRYRAFSEALPDTLQLLSGALAAGLSLAQGVDTVVREGQEPLAGEFKRVLVETRLGVTIEDALEGIATRFESADFAWVVMAIRTQRQVGGNLAELFDTVAGTMRERQYIRRQVASLAAEGKLSAIVIGSLPPIFTLYLAMTNPTYLHPLFHDVRGVVMVVFGVLWLAIGTFWMSKLVKVEV